MAKEKFAIIETGGKQYLVEEGTVISVELLSAKVNDTVTFDNVLLVSNKGSVSVGTPNVKENVSGVLLDHEKDKKVRVFKFKKKTGFKKTQGHRQRYSTVKITSIGGSSKEKAASTEKAVKKTSDATKQPTKKAATSAKKTTEATSSSTKSK